MESFISIFFPTFMAMGIRQIFDKEKKEWYQVVVEYGILNILINLFVMIFMQFGLHFTGGIEYSIENSLKYEIIYIILALAVAIMVPFAEQIMKKYISITFSVKELEDEKKED